MNERTELFQDWNCVKANTLMHTQSLYRSRRRNPSVRAEPRPLFRNAELPEACKRVIVLYIFAPLALLRKRWLLFWHRVTCLLPHALGEDAFAITYLQLTQLIS